MDVISLLLAFFVGIVASFIGGLTSGGGGFVSLSFLIFLGLPPQVAIATDRFGSFGFVISALYKFLRSKKVVFTYLLPLILLGVIGGLIGAHLVLSIDKEVLTKLIGCIILLLLPVVLWKKDMGVKRKKAQSRGILLVGYLLYFLSAIYDGFLGVAGGVLVAYLFVFLFGFTYTEANATEKIPYAANALISIWLFATNNLIYYHYGIALFLGSLIGGYLGAHVAIKKGDKWVRVVFMVIALISSIKLLLYQ